MALSLGMAAPAHADISITAANCASCDLVSLFDDANAADNFMYGTTNGGQSLLFTGIETLADTGPGAGVAWAGAADGTLTFLDIGIESGFTFTDLGFNLNEVNAAGNPSWVVSIAGIEDNGAQTLNTFTLNQNTMFWVHAFNGQKMTNVTIQLLDGVNPADENGVPFTQPNGQVVNLALDGVGQIKIGGIAAVVPEPMTWALMIVGFAGMGSMLRRRRAQGALA